MATGVETCIRCYTAVVAVTCCRYNIPTLSVTSLQPYKIREGKIKLILLVAIAMLVRRKYGSDILGDRKKM